MCAHTVVAQWLRTECKVQLRIRATADCTGALVFPIWLSLELLKHLLCFDVTVNHFMMSLHDKSKQSHSLSITSNNCALIRFVHIKALLCHAQHNLILSLKKHAVTAFKKEREHSVCEWIQTFTSLSQSSQHCCLLSSLLLLYLRWEKWGRKKPFNHTQRYTSLHC